MSYCSRLYKHRNAHVHDELQQKPFFSKQHDVKKGGQKNVFFQTKLAINAPGDGYEREADAVAHAVVNKSTQTPVVQRKKISSIQRLSTPVEEEKQSTNDQRQEQDKERNIHRKAMNPEKEKLERVQKKEEPLKEDEEAKKTTPVQTKQEGSAAAASTQLSSKIESSAGKGSALPAKTLHEMSRSFGVDFGGVRVHHDSEAASMNKELQAQAFTHGNDIYFNQGKYDPQTSDGKFLLAHELTHVVQQGGQGVIRKQGSPPAKLPPLSPDELMNFMLSQRGFGTSTPGPPAIDPKGIGKPTGKGYQTYAGIQIIDKEGRQVKVSMGAYLSGGDLHGETQAINALRNSLPEGTDLKGGKMMLVVEQLPCPNCDSSIRSFAKEIGVSEFSVYVPERASVRNPGQMVKPKTAATGAFQGGRGPTSARLLVSESIQEAGAVSKEVAAEAKAAAKAAVASLEADLKVLKFSHYLTTALAVLDAINSILTAVEFFSMAENKLKGGAFILGDYVNKANEINNKADDLDKGYPQISGKLSDMQVDLFRAAGDPARLGNIVLDVLDFKLQLSKLHKGLTDQATSIEKSQKEAESKSKTAMKILEDPGASTAIAAATFGDVELARLFAVSQDMQQISSILSGALSTLNKNIGLINDDIGFLQAWYDALLGLCKNDPTCKTIIQSGYYTLTIVSAKLPDSFWDTPDAYVELPKNGGKTSVIDDTTSPVWNEAIGSFGFERLNAVAINVYDHDPISADDLLGSFVANLQPSNPEGQTFTLSDAEVSLVVKVDRELYNPKE